MSYKCEKSSMNVQQFPRAFWDQVQSAVHDSSTSAPPSVCNRSLRSLAPKMSDNHNITTNQSFSVLSSYDLHSYIKSSGSGLRRPSPVSYNSEGDTNPQVEMTMTHTGGTRWNPTQDQIGILEMIYKGGMRTPNANQIEQIADKLSKYGKIEGKNVFYWFQNHKARERQKQKRDRLASHGSVTFTSLLQSDIITKEDYHDVGVSEGAQKRRCRSLNSVEKKPFEKECDEAMKNRPCRSEEDGSVCRTLQLFPLHPEGKKMSLFGRD